MENRKKQVEELMSLPWEYRIVAIPPGLGGGFEVNIPLLGAQRCRGYGKTVEKAYKFLMVVMEDMFNDYLEKNFDIPVPDHEDKYSGTFLVRTTRSLHSRLAHKAQQEGVSLNYLVGMMLEAGIATKKYQTPSEPCSPPGRMNDNMNIIYMEQLRKESTQHQEADSSGLKPVKDFPYRGTGS